MSIWEDVQRLESLAIQVAQSRDRVIAENAQLREFLQTFSHIAGPDDQAYLNAGQLWIETAIEANNEAAERIKRFRDFLEMYCDRVRKAGS